MNVAIVTGASSGLGWEYAKQLAPRPEVDEVWLVARRRARLEELADQLVGAEGRVFAIDLTDPDQLAGLFSALADEQPQVAWLVNNAGFGKAGRFEQIEADTHLRMLDLNVRALTEITHRVLPSCVAGSKILQVASSAGYRPLGNFAVYAASKSYVMSFANALAAELAPRNITVTAVCPGPVATEFMEIAGMEVGGEMPEFMYAKPGDVVRKSLADARKGKLDSVYGASIKAFAQVSGLIPKGLAARLGLRAYEK